MAVDTTTPQRPPGFDSSFSSFTAGNFSASTGTRTKSGSTNVIPGLSSEPANPWTTPGPIPTPPPGRWRHPQMAEITRRVNATRFGHRNGRVLVWSVPALIVSFYIPTLLRMIGKGAVGLTVGPGRPGPVDAVLPGWVSTLDVVLLVVRVLLIVNVYIALKPLWTEPDELADIALTPAQRALLDLPPLSEKSSRLQRRLLDENRISQYVTPPRYVNPTTGSNRSTPASGSKVKMGNFYRGSTGRTDRKGRRNSIGGNPGSAIGDLARPVFAPFDRSTSASASPARRLGHSLSRSITTNLPTLAPFDLSVSSPSVASRPVFGNTLPGLTGSTPSTPAAVGTHTWGDSITGVSVTENKGAMRHRFLFERTGRSSTGGGSLFS